MSKQRLPRPVRSIRFGFLAFMLGISAIAILILALIAAYTTQETGAGAKRVSSQALLEQAQEYLVQLNASQARENDLILEKIQLIALEIGSYTQAIYNNPDVFTQEYWPAEDHLTPGLEGQLANSKDDTSSVFLPNFATLTEAAARDVELGAYLDYVFGSALQNAPNIGAIYYATPNEVTRYYPNIDLGEALPPDFKVTGRPWYAGTQTGDGMGRPYWAPVYTDATGLGQVTTYAVPVYSPDKQLLGVLGMDITLEGITKNIESTRFLEDGYSFLLDQKGIAIAIPEQGYQDLGIQPPEEGEANPDLKAYNTPLTPILGTVLSGGQGIQTVQVGERKLMVAYAPLKSTGWVLISVADAQSVLKGVGVLESQLEDTTESLIFARLLPVSLVIFLAVLILGYILTNRMVRPVQNLAVVAQRLGAGEWDAPMPQTGNDEVGMLSASLQQMAGDLQEMVTSLETRVAQRTADLERRTTQLQVASEVARDATAVTASDGSGRVEALLDRSVNLIRDRFGFYHAGIFLIDQQTEFAVLQAATGEAGRLLLEKGHRLKVGETGLVGYATGKGAPRISPDVTQDPKHYRNPYLPDTRSEMVLPMRVGTQVIGALDVQSREVAAFDEDDVTVLQTLADQLAVAIDNTRLVQRLQGQLTELEAIYSQYNRDAWDQIKRIEPVVGYRYDRSGAKPIRRNQMSELSSVTKASPVKIPLKVRDEVIGDLEVWPNEDGLSSDDMELLHAVSDRVSQAMESARLFEESQSRATREQVINRVATEVRSSIHVETILRNTIRELGQVLSASRTFIQLGIEPNQAGEGKTLSLPTSDDQLQDNEKSNGKNGKDFSAGEEP